MDKKSQEIFDALYALHDRYDEDLRHEICADGAELIRKLCNDLKIMTARAEKAEAENRWIPVSERMPKDPGWYQVFRKGHSHAEDGYFRGKTWSFGKHYGEVTHWRPLPEPPKGE